MKVSNKTPNPMQNAEAAKLTKSQTGSVDKKKSGAASGFDAVAGSSAKVDVSSRAQDLKKAKELATPSQDIDEAKVARLQKMIDEGKYKVDAEAVADRLVDAHLDMPN